MSRFENTSLIDSEIKTSLISAKTFTQEKRYKDFGQFAQKPYNGGSRLRDDEDFFVMYLKYKMHLGQFQDIISVLENVENASNPVYIKLWDEANYRQYLFKHGGRLTAVHKFRIRQRNPPPPGICPGGARPQFRLAKSSVAVLRKWFNAHSESPYPCRKAKHVLAERAGIPLSKVTTWFSNARRKHKKELQRLNKQDKANGTMNEKYQHEKVQKKTNPVYVSVETKGLEMIKNNGNANFCKIVDDRSLYPSNTVTSAMATKSYWDYENACNYHMSSFDKSVQFHKKQKGRKTFKYSDCLMPCQRLPFSEVDIRDNRETEKTSSNGILHGYNYYRNNQNQIKRNKQNLTCKQFLHSSRNDHNMQSLAVPDCKNQTTTHKGSEMYNKVANMKNTVSVLGYRQIQQTQKFGKRHLETKMKDFNLVSKLRAKLKEKHIKGNKPKEKASNGIRTAVSPLKSLQKLCQHLENSVKSPVDYAYGVEFDDSEEVITEKYSVTNSAESPFSLAHTSDCRINSRTKPGPKSIYGEITDWSENIFPRLSQHRPTWNDEEETFQNLFIGTEAENKILGSARKYSQRDQVAQCPLDMYNSHMFSSGGIQHYRSPGTNWENMWTSWCNQPSQDVMKGSQLDTSTLEDYHYSGSYSTVVGEAIQGLLNLSSTQEYGSNSLQALVAQKCNKLEPMKTLGKGSCKEHHSSCDPEIQWTGSI